MQKYRGVLSILLLLVLVVGAAIASVALEDSAPSVAAVLLLRGLIAPGNDVVAVLITAALMTLLDLGYRLRNDNFVGRSKWISMKAGAYLAFFPLWGGGVALLVIALVQLVTGQAIFKGTGSKI